MHCQREMLFNETYFQENINNDTYYDIEDALNLFLSSTAEYNGFVS